MKPHVPRVLPLGDIDWASHVRLIAEANSALGRYDGMLQSMVNPMVLLSPLTTQEAVLSSRIEGTQASLQEVLAYEAGGVEDTEPARQADIQEIVNYRRAMGQAVEQLKTRPITLNLLKELHATLLNSVRGRDKARGQFRREQNHIGALGEPIEKASYVPPIWERVEPAMSNWERYLHAEEKDRLVQLAVAKAQFELIHPFLDGNGRLGRMLVPLYLYEHGVLSYPMFYISAYFETHRELYIQRLRAISQEGDWDGWIGFFLQALVAQAQSNTLKTKGIIALYERMKLEIPSITHSQYVVQAIDALFDQPVFGSQRFVRRSGIPEGTAMRLLRELRKANIIRELRPKSGRQAAVMIFDELIGITEATL